MNNNLINLIYNNSDNDNSNNLSQYSDAIIFGKNGSLSIKGGSQGIQFQNIIPSGGFGNSLYKNVDDQGHQKISIGLQNRAGTIIDSIELTGASDDKPGLLLPDDYKIIQSLDSTNGPQTIIDYLSDAIQTEYGASIVRGIQGNQGDQGNPGPQGTQGNQGTQGAKGPQGGAGNISGLTTTDISNGIQRGYLVGANNIGNVTELFTDSNIYMENHNLYTASDLRLKENLTEISKEFIDKIYNYDKDLIYDFKFKDTGKFTTGFIAQYLEELDENLIDNNGEYKAVNYFAALSKLVCVLIKKTKELNDRILELEKNNC